jgi:hypothetical protein
MAWVAVKGDEAVTWDGWYSRAFMGVPESLEPLNFCESEDEKVGLNLRQLGVAMQGANFIPDFDESVTEYLKARVDWRHWRPSAAELSRFDSNDIVAFLNLGDLNLHSSASSDE